MARCSSLSEPTFTLDMYALDFRNVLRGETPLPTRFEHNVTTPRQATISPDGARLLVGPFSRFGFSSSDRRLYTIPFAGGVAFAAHGPRIGGGAGLGGLRDRHLAGERIGEDEVRARRCAQRCQARRAHASRFRRRAGVLHGVAGRGLGVDPRRSTDDPGPAPRRCRAPDASDAGRVWPTGAGAQCVGGWSLGDRRRCSAPPTR